MQAGAKLCEGMGSQGSRRKAAASHQLSKGNTLGSREVGRFGRKTDKGLFQCTCREGIKWPLTENRNSQMAAATVLQSIPWSREQRLALTWGHWRGPLTRAQSDRTRGNGSTLTKGTAGWDIRKEVLPVRAVRPWPLRVFSKNTSWREMKNC